MVCQIPRNTTDSDSDSDPDSDPDPVPEIYASRNTTTLSRKIHQERPIYID